MKKSTYEQRLQDRQKGVQLVSHEWIHQRVGVLKKLKARQKLKFLLLWRDFFDRGDPFLPRVWFSLSGTFGRPHLDLSNGLQLFDTASRRRNLNYRFWQLLVEPTNRLRGRSRMNCQRAFV